MKKIKMDGNRLPFLGDPDMEFLNYYTPEERKWIWDLCKPKNIELEGKMIIYGTCGELMINKFEEMFYDARTD